MLQEQGEREWCKSACSKIFELWKRSPVVDSWMENWMVWAVGRNPSQGHGHAIQERQHSVSVLTNQYLGKEMDAEPPGRGTEEPRTRILPDSNKFIVEILGSHFCACAKISMMTAKDGCKLILLENIQSNAFRQPVSSLHELLQFYGGIWNEWCHATEAKILRRTKEMSQYGRRNLPNMERTRSVHIKHMCIISMSPLYVLGSM